jgi:hypothetical protein
MHRRRVVELSPRAAREVERVRQWCREHRTKAPDAVDEELSELIDRLEADAEHVGVRVRNMPGIRRVLLARIHYYEYFRIVDTAALVQVAALWHASRGRQPRIR